MGADVPPWCPGLSADSPALTALPALGFSGYSAAPAASSLGRKSKARTAKRDRLSLLTQFIWPLASSCHFLRSIQGRAGARSSCGSPCNGAASDPAPSLSRCPCGRHHRAPHPCLQEHLWALGRALCAEQAQPHSPEGRGLSPALCILRAPTVHYYLRDYVEG